MPVCHLSDRNILRIAGPDARPFLQGLLTQDMNLLAAGRPLYAGLLSPQGKALFDLFLFANGADVLLDVDAGRAEALAKRLAMFRLRRKVEIAAEPGLRIFQRWGEDGDDPRLAAAGSRFIGDAVADAAPETWHAFRLGLGLPASDEIGSDELMWLETNARELNGVSFTKGCYTGQENTARMHHRDKLRKRLLPLRIPAQAEGPVMAGTREAGELRGAAHGGVRMALLRMDFADAPLTVAGEPAELLRPAWLEE